MISRWSFENSNIFSKKYRFRSSYQTDGHNHVPGNNPQNIEMIATSSWVCIAIPKMLYSCVMKDLLVNFTVRHESPGSIAAFWKLCKPTIYNLQYIVYVCYTIYYILSIIYKVGLHNLRNASYRTRTFISLCTCCWSWSTAPFEKHVHQLLTLCMSKCFTFVR